MCSLLPCIYFLNSVYCFDSLDGVPFILHDSTFLRTTNIEKVFPSLKDEDASNFNMSQIKQLNAGLWFMEVTCYSYFLCFHCLNWWIHQMMSSSGKFLSLVNSIYLEFFWSAKQSDFVPWMSSAVVSRKKVYYRKWTTFGDYQIENN